MAMNPYLEETDEIYEIWDGVKRMMSPSSPQHEKVLVKISFLIASFVFDNKLGDLFASNTAVYLKADLQDKDFVMPDFTFVSKANRSIVHENGLYGAPDLVVEVVSPGVKNTKRDIVDKYGKYEQYGVKEYWIVDPIGEDIEIFSLQQGKYALVERSAVLDGIELDRSLIFASDTDD